MPMRKTLALEQREEALTVSHELKVLAEMASLPTQAERRTLSRGRGPGTRRGTRRSKKAR